jgi:hypothetical protein
MQETAFFLKSDPAKKISYAQAVRATGKSQFMAEETFSCHEMEDTCFATHIAEVEVDPERGYVESSGSRLRTTSVSPLIRQRPKGKSKEESSRASASRCWKKCSK